MPIKKPAGAWQLLFVDGPLAGVTDRWNLTCPNDWAHKNKETGQVSRYRLREADESGKVATMELQTDDSA